ncbi:MAG: restriction endonuclease subunit S [Candidatus Thermoplasmatota archaeon]|nr:restriction endonuclease subunit S [Candidatus Thermoplasmatota archaeon]
MSGNNIPEGWKRVKLGDVAEIVGGGTPKTTVTEFWNDEIAWLTPRDLSKFSGRYICNGERNISKLGLEKSSAKILPKGTVLLSSRAPVGYLAIAANEISTNQGFRSLIPNSETNNLFLFYLLKNNVEYLKSQSTGTTFGELAGSTLKLLSFLFPPLPEQRAIALVLSSLDDKIDMLHHQNETLEAMAETLFRQWLVEEADAEWEERPLDEIADYLNGLACQKYPPKNEIDILPVLKIKELRNGFTDKSDWASTDIPDEYFVQSGDIIFSWSGSLMVKIWDGADCILNQHLFKVTSEHYPKWFYYLWTKHHMNRFISIAEGKATTMGHIKRGDLSNSKVLIPETSEFEDMDKNISPMVDKIVINNYQIRKLESMRNLLLPKLISGEVRVEYGDT